LTKKFIIKEVWLLDEKEDKSMKINLMEKDAIPCLLKEENVRGGYGTPNIGKEKFYMDEQMRIMIRNYNYRLLNDLKEMEDEEGSPKEALTEVIKFMEEKIKGL
jgi:hypothetical protein